ncbi:hypothetical protein FB388_2228 [Pseudonocardia cypriaca]|uniref:Uncharacterized protein n=1 Tax=Pseudonocardia cypriaca TaxID=882449 RepID=A0A543GFM1_9PSEU|nr:hypothetical protein FB388_2228 [Pseudonocardia cypriaca]
MSPGIAGWWRTGLGFLRRGGAALAALAALAAAVDAMASTLASILAVGLVAWIGEAVSLVVRAWVYGAAMLMLVQPGGAPVGAVAALGKAGRRLPLLVGWLLIAVVLVVAGLAALLVPGLYLLVVLGSTVIAVVTVEGRGLRRCLGLVRGRFWSTAARFLMTLAPAVGWWWGTEALASTLPVPLSWIAAGALAVPAYMAVAAFLATTYVELIEGDRRRPDPVRTAPAAAAGSQRDIDVPRPGDATGTEPLDTAPRQRTAQSSVVRGTAGVVAGLLLVLAGAAVWGSLRPSGVADQVGSGEPSAPAPVPTTAAAAFAETYTQSRRDGSASYTADPGKLWDGLGYFGSTGEVRFDGDTASVHARLSDPKMHVREVAVVDGQRWIKGIYPLPEGGWDPCSVQEGGLYAAECAFTLYQQDLADPLALLVRAGPAARVTATDIGLVDGVRARWFDVAFDEDLAARRETDPGWRTRFADTLFAVGSARLWVDPDQRLLRMDLPPSAGGGPDQARVLYTGWGTVDAIAAPS